MAHTSTIFKNLKILKLHDIYDFQISKIMFKINRNLWLGKFNLVKTNQIHSHNTRASQAGNFYTTGNKIKNSSITRIGPKVWFKIPKETKQLTFNLFKKIIKNEKLATY